MEHTKGAMMQATGESKGQGKVCKSCEGGIAKLAPREIERRLKAMNGWRALAKGKKLGKECHMANFRQGMSFLNEVARVAEQENHHPDLHLEQYRNVRIELTTHSVGGLTENDFILAEKIDSLLLNVESGLVS